MTRDRGKSKGPDVSVGMIGLGCAKNLVGIVDVNKETVEEYHAVKRRWGEEMS